jgi:uncharacterized protein YnzC (UPF0291/DUF896 family)
MITPEIISRINELGRKQKAGALTEEEIVEQAKLRRLYIDNIKGQVKAHCDAQKMATHSHDCSCGCGHKH